MRKISRIPYDSQWFLSNMTSGFVILIEIVIVATITVLFLFTPAVASHLYTSAWRSSGNEMPDCFESALAISNCDWSEEYFQGLSLWSNVASATPCLQVLCW